MGTEQSAVDVESIPAEFRFPAAENNFPAGFPFDDEGLRGRHDFRHRLEELAQQHPEFADSLRPWYSETQQAEPAQPSKSTGSSPRQGPSNAPSDAQPAQEPEQQQQQQQPEQARGIQHHGLRNTVDIGQARQAQQQMDAQDDRVKRAQSAPPDNPPKEQQRFVSRLEINPAPGQAATNQDPAAAKPPVAPKHTPQQPPQQTKQAGNVRHIPIFVEGRDEPVMPKHDVDSSTSFSHNFNRPSMGGIHENVRFGDSPRFTSSAHHQFRPQESHHPEPQTHKRPFPQQQSQPRPPPQSHPQSHPQSQPQPQAHPQAPPQPQPQQTPPPPPKQPTKPKDSLEKVSEVRKEVEELAKQVEAFVGRKQDKNYLYLDEMLTRNLIKLDLVETEGREDVRAARRETIRAIQNCISLLEYKAMTPEEREARAKAEEAMEVESSESQSMDTEPSVEPAQPASDEATKTEGEEASTAEANPDSKPQVSTESKPTEGQSETVQESAVSSSTTADNAEAAERITSTGSSAEVASQAAAPSEGASVTSTESAECGLTPDSTQVQNVLGVKAS